jgi:glycosyltransferase involved in cell wall biosynthesis
MEVIMPKISAIVPVYNTEKYLNKCLNSIINQTYKDFEIIIVNDGSTDNSENIILKYKNKYPEKIKYFKIKNNGISNARNFAIQKVSGDYFLFVDSDDYLATTLFSSLAIYIEKNIDLIKYKMKIIKNNISTEVNGPVLDSIKGEDGFNKICFKDILIDTPCLYLFKTSFYKNNKFTFSLNRYHEDFGLIPLIIIKANTFSSISVYGYNYMQTENSITRNSNHEKTITRAYDLLFHYDNMIKYIQQNNFNKKTINNVKQYYTNAILNKIKDLGAEDKEKYIKEIKKRSLIKNIKIKNIKSIIKKFYYGNLI